VIKVDVISRIGWDREMNEDLDALVKEAVRLATLDMAIAAVELARPRARGGHHRHMREITEMVVFPFAEGWSSGFEGGIVSPTWYAWFQSSGTLGARVKPVKQATLDRRSSPSGRARFAKVAGRRGITPLLFFEEASKAGRTSLKSRVDALT
jgi:hypothetical protein